MKERRKKSAYRTSGETLPGALISILNELLNLEHHQQEYLVRQGIITGDDEAVTVGCISMLSQISDASQ